ncbi:hypothetical protein [Helicobacter sp. T3_23-1056]
MINHFAKSCLLKLAQNPVFQNLTCQNLLAQNPLSSFFKSKSYLPNELLSVTFTLSFCSFFARFGRF